MPRSVIVCITGAAGKIAYSLYNTLCSSDVFGSDIEIILRLVEIEDKLKQLEIVKMELEDCCYIRVRCIQLFSANQHEQIFKDADVVIFLGSIPRQPGMDKWEVYENNAKLFAEHGRNLDLYAKKNCKSLVVSNPSNTNCLVLAHNAPSIPMVNFISLNRLDYNRFVNHVQSILFRFVISLVAIKKKIRNLLVWGNHSKYHFCDINYLEIDGFSTEQIKEKTQGFESRVVEKELHSRGGFIADKMGAGAYMSAAKSIIDQLRDWFMNLNKIVSMGVILQKEVYGIPKGLCFSVPVKCFGDGRIEIFQKFQINEEQKIRIAESIQELEQEKEVVKKYLNQESELTP